MMVHFKKIVPFFKICCHVTGIFGEILPQLSVFCSHISNYDCNFQQFAVTFRIMTVTFNILRSHFAVVKSAKDVLIKPLTLLMNQIIHTGEFPKQLKIAKVKPLFKNGNESSFTNSRSISLLPSIFEHVMTSQLMEYFTSNNLFCLQQFGFRPGHST